MAYSGRPDAAGWQVSSPTTPITPVTASFLTKRCVPLLKETAAFYEDFLTETDKDGRVTFIPSYNPETGCGINATMDIAVAREMLRKLIAACRELRSSEHSAKWEALLAKLPPYPINADGELAEWPGGRRRAGHRHHSQLYPCFQSFDPLFETDMALRKAAQASVRAKIAGKRCERRRAIFVRPRAVRRVGGISWHGGGSLRPVESDGGETLDESEPDHLARAERRHLQHRRQRRHPANRQHDASAKSCPA